jgi:hypothetical protein
MKKLTKSATRTLAVAALAAAALTTSTPAAAGQGCGESTGGFKHRGFMVGLNAGGAGSQFMYKDGTRSISEEPLAGGLGQLRVGYDLSRRFSVGLESIGFTSKEDDADWELGAVMATVTWRPMNRGFFVRAGLGVGGGDLTDPQDGDRLALGSRAAALFGVGYEWLLGEHVGLGLAADGFGLDAGGVTGFDDDHVGAGGVTVQFNWYL